MCFFIKKKTVEKKKRTRGLWMGLLLLAASAGLAVWCVLWGLPRLLPSAAAPSSSPLPDPPSSAEPYNRQGTKALAESAAGDELDVLMPLGNGFDTGCRRENPLLVGGGIGVPPLYGLACELVDKGIIPKVVIGFNTANDLILAEDFRELGIEPVITTADGSSGIRGFVTDAMKNLEFDYVYTCGPEPMLKAVYDLAPDGQFSFEARMACGFGACMGCTCETKYGYKRICKDGPILYKEEIKW